MSYGDGQPKSLSACNAEFLAAHPYFSTEEGGAGAPSIVVTSPETYPAGSEKVPVQLEVSAPDGLHQVMLLVRTVGDQYRREGLDFAVGFLEVKACLGFSGETQARVEFEYDGVIPSGGFTSLSDPAVHPITVFAVDRDGDVGSVFRELVQASPYIIATHETEEVTSAALSPDGSTLALGRQDSRVELRDVATGASAGFLGSGHLGFVSAVAFSPDGSTLASGAEDEAIRLWDVSTGSEVLTTPRHYPRVSSLALSPDGSTLAVGTPGGGIKLWDAASGEHLGTVGNRVVSLAWSADGRTLVSGSSDGEVELWDVAASRKLAALEGHTDEIVSGDEQQGQPGEDLAEPFVVEVRDQSEDPLSNVEVTFRVVAHDGRLGGRFTVEKVRTDANGRAASRLTLGPNPGRNRVEAAVGGLAVTFGSVGLGTPMPPMDGDSRTWHLPDGAMARLGKGAFGFNMEGDKAVSYSPDGRCLAVGSRTGIWLYDAATAREAALLPLAEDIHSLAFSPGSSCSPARPAWRCSR